MPVQFLSKTCQPPLQPLTTLAQNLKGLATLSLAVNPADS